MSKTCLISEKPTFRTYENLPVHRDVLEFGRRYRDKANLKCLRGVLSAFYEMKKVGYTWEQIKEKLINEVGEV